MKTGLIIMQITRLNFYRDLDIHGFCTWNENTVQLRLTMFLLALYFLYGCLLLPRRQASFPLRLGFPGAQLCCEPPGSQRVKGRPHCIPPPRGDHLLPSPKKRVSYTPWHVPTPSHIAGPRCHMGLAKRKFQHQLALADAHKSFKNKTQATTIRRG